MTVENLSGRRVQHLLRPVGFNFKSAAGHIRGWRDAIFDFRDKIEILLHSVSCLETRPRFFHLISGFETRSRFCSLNLRLRDEIENFCHLISKFETRSRIFNENFYLSCDIWNCIFLYSTNTYFWIRKSPKYVFHHVLILNKSVLLLLQLSHWEASRSNPRQDFLTPWKVIVEWGQSNCNTSKSTFTFVRLVSRHCARMRQSLQKSGESESSVMVLGKMMLFIIFTHVWINYMYDIWRWKKQ